MPDTSAKTVKMDLINLGIIIIYLISATFVSLTIAMAIHQDREVKKAKQELNNLKQWQERLK